jgi:hypothetical protein
VFFDEQACDERVSKALVADDSRRALVLLVDDPSHFGVDLLPRFFAEVAITKLAGPSR